jgi:hypothetical protein
MTLFTTALGLYGGVLWSGELHGIILHRPCPTQGPGPAAHREGGRAIRPSQGERGGGRGRPSACSACREQGQGAWGVGWMGGWVRNWNWNWNWNWN